MTHGCNMVALNAHSRLVTLIKLSSLTVTEPEPGNPRADLKLLVSPRQNTHSVSENPRQNNQYKLGMFYAPGESELACGRVRRTIMRFSTFAQRNMCMLCSVQHMLRFRL